MHNLIKLLVLILVALSYSSAQSINTGYLNIGNDKIYYEEQGEGPIIIFIHDGLVHSAIWDYQFSSFSKNHKVIRYDRRGYGKSSAVSNSLSLIDELNSIYTHFGIDKACLIAMSSGGRLAINFTLKYPSKVTSLILVGAVVGGFTYTKHFNTRGGHLPSHFSSVEEERMYYAAEDPYEVYSGNKEAKKKIIQLVKNNSSKGHGANSGYSNEKQAYLRLNEINVPALILVGEFDMPDVHAHAGVINAGILNSKREIIPNAGHLIPIEQPESFYKVVCEFLKE